MMAETDENRPPTPEPVVQEQEEITPAAVQQGHPVESATSPQTSTASASATDEVSMDTDDTPAMVARSEPPNPLMVDFPKDNKHRVKLYVLNEQRSWDDKGTGHVACLPIPGPPETLCLTVRSENDHSNVLESKILLDTAYQKQQETLIVWSESDSCDLALSFQEKAGCEEIWEKICQVQGKDPSNDVTQDVGAFEADNDESDANDSGTSAGSAPMPGNAVQLPACDVSRLREIENIFSASLHSPIRRESLALAIENQNYIPKLCDTFRMCEDLDNIESLRLLYQIIKSMFMLNKNALLEILFNERHLKDVVGILEYDPSLPEPKRHRDYLWGTAAFREVIPIKSPELKAKIHQTYRVQYIQDVILPAPSIFEENMLSSLNSFIFFNRVEIVAMIQDDDQFLNDLFGQLRAKDTAVERRRDLTLFLKEFCTFAQTLQPSGPQGREVFFKTLMTQGVLSAVEECLRSPDDATRAATIEIFAMVVDHSPQLARDYLLTQGKNSELEQDDLLINKLIAQLFNDPDPELTSAMQLLHVLRLLVDPDNMMTAPASKSEKTEFLSFFYKRAMGNLCKPLMENTTGKRPTKDDYHTAHKLSLVLEILCFCIEHHSWNIRNFCTNKDVLKRVLVLLKSSHAFLALGALRLFRRVVQLKDEVYNRYIVGHNLFEPIVQCFKSNGHRYNLMNSALLELFEFIRTEDVKTLLFHFVEQHIGEFEEVDYVKTFANLKLKYDQHKDREKEQGKSMVGGSPINPPPVWKRDQRELDKDEEGWFNEDDEEWDDGKTSPNSRSKTPPMRDDEDGESLTTASKISAAGPSTASELPSNFAGASEADENVVAPPLKNTKSGQSYPSVLGKRRDDESSSTGVFSPMPNKSLGGRTGQAGGQRIVIKVPSVLSPSGDDSQQQSAASPSSSSSSPPGDQVVSSTQLSAGPGGSGSSPVIFKPISSGGGLVDYDVGDSDSDDEDTKSPDKPTSSTRNSSVSDDGGDESPPSEDVSSTSDHKDAASPEPVKKRLKLDDTPDEPMETC